MQRTLRTALRLCVALIGVHVVYSFFESAASWSRCWLPSTSCSIGFDEITGAEFPLAILWGTARNLFHSAYSIHFPIALGITLITVIGLRSSLEQARPTSRVVALVVLGMFLGTAFAFLWWGLTHNPKLRLPEYDFVLPNAAAFAAATVSIWWAIGQEGLPLLERQFAANRLFARPLRLTLVGAAILVMPLAAAVVYVQHERRIHQVGVKPPQLTLSANGKFQTGVLIDYIWDGGGIAEKHLPAVPKVPLLVAPREWLEFSTHAAVGLPSEAKIRFTRASAPTPCFDDGPPVDFACTRVDVDSMTDALPMVTDPAGKFGFAAPEVEGIYKVSLDCWWPEDLGGGHQAFIIDVRI